MDCRVKPGNDDNEKCEELESALVAETWLQ
jgi:hypothetical protein